VERLVLRGDVLAICPDGDDLVVATDEALHRVDRRGRARRIATLPGTYTLDLLVTETTIFFTDHLHPMQTAWRRRACAVAREGGPVRALTEELAWTRGFVRAADVVIGATFRAFIRFDRDGNRLDDLLTAPGADAADDDPRKLHYVTTIALRDDRLFWSTHRELTGISRICSVPLTGGDVRIQRESRDEDLLVPGEADGLADHRQLEATAGGVRYFVREAGLFAATSPSFWERLLGLD